MTSKFYREIKSSTIERQVEDVYNKGINLYFGHNNITYPFGCDGYVVYENKEEMKQVVKLLVEYKFDKDLSNSIERAKVLLQVIYYLKSFESNGKELPNIVLIGDKNECFIIHTNNLIKYLDYDIDWTIAPSNASSNNIDLCIEISNDEKCNNSYIYEVNDNFSFKVVADAIKDLANNIKRFIHINEDNITNIYNTFIKKVLSKSNNIKPNDLVGLFIGIISDNVNFYPHPTRKNIIVSPYGNIKIKYDGYIQFIENFSREYTPIEKRKFTEISDRLIENTNRRNKGEFYTPKLFVDYAHNMITEQLGENWKEEYVVWDNSCGTKNLTKDYHFNELYCSTLENAELEMSAKYNQNATSFQFDFLNDNLDKLPQGLKNAFEQNKPFVFLLNPPYATGASGNGKHKEKGTTTSSLVNKLMNENKIGGCCENLYAQFLYRIFMIKEEYHLTNCYVALFSPTLYLSGGSWKNFRKVWLNNFSFKNGCVFKASHFADCASNWGISFSLWNNGESIDKENFKHILIDNENDIIIEKGTKDIYNIDFSLKASDWIREELKGIKTFDYPNLSSAIVIKNDNKTFGTSCENAFGYCYNCSNNINKNLQSVALFSSSFSNGHGVQVIQENFEKCVSLFSARRNIQCTWDNWQDEYMIPNTEHKLWKQYVADSVIFSLFDTKSQQSSLRNIEYKGKTYDIKNEFFWMSKSQMMEISSINHLDDTYEQCSQDNDRYVYKWLYEHYNEMSAKAKDVLRMASKLTLESIKYRELFNEYNEQYQIMNWDCGWYQIKAMLKEYMPNELKEFNDLYKSFAEELRPMVYELGFLKK